MKNYILHAPETLICVFVLASIAYFMKSMMTFIIAILVLILMLTFYRGASFDLSNVPKNILVCPCDGKVLEIKYHDRYVQIAVFLNVHNVHVQYMPFDGTIKDMKYHKGEFHPAYMFEKSQYNERLETTIATDVGDIYLVQIAGLVARRIVSFHKLNAHVNKGDPFGLIKFGSRVDVWIPRKKISKVLVSKNDRVKIGTKLVQFT